MLFLYHPHKSEDESNICFSVILPQHWPPWYVFLWSCWSSSPEVGGIFSIEHPRVKISLRNRFMLVCGLVLSYSRFMNHHSRHLVSLSISSTPLLSVRKASVTLFNNFHLFDAVFFLIVLKDDIASQPVNTWNKGNTVAFSLPIAIHISWAEISSYIHQHRNLPKFACLCVDLMLPQHEQERLCWRFIM